MSDERRFSAPCPVCDKRTWMNRELTFSLNNYPRQTTLDGKYLVTVLRRHCQDEHPRTPIWNVVPENRQKENTTESRIEYFIHKAMRAASINCYTSKSLTKLEFYAAFCTRMESILCWIRWSKMAKQKLRGPLCSEVASRLQKIYDMATIHIKSEEFDIVLRNHSLKQL